MAARKLQQEIEKTFKKVTEGRETFQSIYDKIQDCENPSQKEKLEDQLKREIKKLQRHRDQIKTWAASNEIKDKKPLFEQRKLIETEMEKFKAVEKEMKTKAFSKEGLSQSAKMDPKEREKAEAGEFLSEQIEELGRQIETLEAEEEALSATVKRGKKDTSKADRLGEISDMMERHRWHQSQLELANRALENGSLEAEQINSIKEDIKYYVQENTSVEFIEDDTIYDELGLDEDGAAWGAPGDIDRVPSHDPHEDALVDGPEMTSATAAATTATSATTGTSAGTPATAAATLAATAGASGGAAVAKPKGKVGSDASGGASARRSSNNFKSPLPSLATLHAPPAATAGAASTSNMKPAPPPTRAPGELQYASAAQKAAASEKTITPLPPPPAPTSGVSPSISALPAAPGSKPASVASPLPSTATPIPPQALPAPKSAQQPCMSSIPPTPVLDKSDTATPPPKSKSPLPKTRLQQQQQQHQQQQQQQQQQSSTSHHEQQQREHTASPEPEQQPKTPPPPAAGDDSRGGPQIEGEEESIFHLPPGLQELIQSFDETREAAAAAAAAVASGRAEAGSLESAQRLLAAGGRSLPDAVDTEKPRAYKPAHRYSTPRYYPQEPVSVVDDPALFGRIDTDTLFFLFYYRQGTYLQYAAARALKQQSWRFHKQYQTWFQRHEEPKLISDEFEQGTYRFFDYESTWMNRRKADFKFAYKFLEDDL